MQYIKAMIAVAFTVFLSCNPNSVNEHAIGKKDNDTLQQSEPAIQSGTLVGKAGQQLFYEFDNSSNTMRIVFNNDTATLKGEQMASGIKYSNSVYTYSEWHGNGVLFKRGVKVFETTKSQ